MQSRFRSQSPYALTEPSLVLTANGGARVPAGLLLLMCRLPFCDALPQAELVFDQSVQINSAGKSIRFGGLYARAVTNADLVHGARRELSGLGRRIPDS